MTAVKKAPKKLYQGQKVDDTKGNNNDGHNQDRSSCQRGEMKDRKEHGKHHGGLRNSASTKTSPKRESSSAVLAIRKNILSIYNRNRKNHYHGSIREDCIEHRKDFLELLEYPYVTDDNRLSLFRHTQKRNTLSRYRSLIRDGNKWNEVDESFMKFFLTKARRERNSSRLECLKFKDFRTAEKDSDEALLDLVRRIEDLVPLSAVRDNDEMVKLNYLLRATKTFEWSKMAEGRLRIPYDIITLCYEMYISIEYFGSPMNTQPRAHRAEQLPRLNYVLEEHQYGSKPYSSSDSSK